MPASPVQPKQHYSLPSGSSERARARLQEHLPTVRPRKSEFHASLSGFWVHHYRSLNDHVDKIRLYVQTVQVALCANALAQTDAIVREVIEQLAFIDCPPATYLNLSSSLLGVLLAVPDSPSKPPLYLFKALLNAIQRYQWPSVCLEKDVCSSVA
ncbi:hypothetical protein L596_006517 [Steinernema carpocapsae]|uniref:Uncharacterized protein n=1 Tax=Steinernema carpocapsae TaxID=34508 RepID=A0A4U8V4T8_STECR|nr:hypothetical protein L596_006517 [Steinernema carpocapsae]